MATAIVDTTLVDVFMSKSEKRNIVKLNKGETVLSCLLTAFWEIKINETAM